MMWSGRGLSSNCYWLNISIDLAMMTTENETLMDHAKTNVIRLVEDADW